MKLNGTEEAIEGVREAISALRRTQTHSAADERARSVEVMRLTGVIESAAKAIVSRDAAKRVTTPPPVSANAGYVTVKDFHTVIEGVAKKIMPYFDELFAHVDALKARISELEARPSFEYQGTWDATKTYTVGDFVTSSGSLWHAEMISTGVRPGSGSAWKLAVKHGQNGKDAK
jgi:hypothetical protein